MNWRITIIILLALGSLYRLLLNIVQNRSAGNPIPANVADVYATETYENWRRYQAENSRLALSGTLAAFFVNIILLITNAYSAFAGLFPSGFFWQLFAVILIHTLAATPVNVVLSYVGTMIIEQKYGFNRSTMKTFVTDQIRNFLLNFVLNLGLVYLLAVIHRGMGDWMILLFTGVVFCITLLITFLYPIFSRIGNKFVPLEDGELKDRLMALLTKHGYRVKAIEVMDASRRTTKLNAYFAGFGKMKTIVLYDNMLNAMTTDEICAVFAHELGHGLYKDVLKQQIMNLGNFLVVSLVAWLTIRTPAIHQAFGFSEINYGFAYIVMSVGLDLITPLIALGVNAYSRFAEYRADRQAVKEGYGPAMILALKKLARENFSHLAPSPLFVALEYSHPPLSERIAAVEKAMNDN